MPAISHLSAILNYEDLILYYGKGGPNDRVGRIDFSYADESTLQHLAEACDAATFGRNQEDVLDESYRKAGKLDIAHFATHFDPSHSGLLADLQGILLEGHSSDTRIRAELYKLNVYGPGSFFKAHQDTPRGDDMFATLVVILPTVHEGGSLILRHDGHQFSFDSAAAIRGADAHATIAYVAFFSDVKHEVEPVQSGYRVTLTYNLFYDTCEDSRSNVGEAASDSMQEYASAVESTIRAALEDPLFFPDGGLAGFGLCHQYSSLSARILKGGDVVLFNICQQLSLKPTLKVVYSDDGERCCVTSFMTSMQPHPKLQNTATHRGGLFAIQTLRVETYISNAIFAMTSLRKTSSLSSG